MAKIEPEATKISLRNYYDKIAGKTDMYLIMECRSIFMM